MSHTLIEAYIGSEAIDDGLRDIFVHDCRLGRFDERREPRRQRGRWKHPGAAPLQTTAPTRCGPSTSTAISGCGTRPTATRSPSSTTSAAISSAFRSDNGAPFASTGIHGLNRLNVWWLQLGIAHQRITPGSSQENGAHERLRQTLKDRAARPPTANLNLQQRAFNRFRATYNELRPHEAPDDETPASRWTPSPRPYPERIAPPEYPGHFEVRKVRGAGTFRLHSGQPFLSQALNPEYIGFEEIADSLWNVVYYETLLGRFDERTYTITGARFRKEKKC